MFLDIVILYLSSATVFSCLLTVVKIVSCVIYLDTTTIIIGRIVSSILTIDDSRFY